MLWGREIELELIKRILGERIPDGLSTRLYLVEGPTGMGKSALLNEIVAYLRTIPRPMILLNPLGWSKIPDTLNAKFLLDSLLTVGVQLPVPLDDEGFGSYWRRLLAMSKAQNPGVVIFIDGYDSLTPHKKIALKEDVVDPLKAFTKSHDARFVLAMAGDLPAVDYETFWNDYKIQKFQLGPLKPEGLKDWLRSAKEPLEVLDELEQKTQGVPAKVEVFLKEKHEARMEAHALKAEETILKEMTEAQRHIAGLAALSDTIGEGVLEYFLGDNKGVGALHWLQNNSGINGSQSDDGFRMAEDHREIIKSWYARRHPLAFAQTLARVQAIKTISDDIAGSRERKILGQLSLLKYFTPTLIEKLYGDDAEDVVRYVKGHPTFFDVSDELWSLAPDYKQAGALAAELMSPSAKEKFMAKVSEAWVARRDEIFKEMEEKERGIVAEREALIKSTKELEVLEPKLNDMAGRIARIITSYSPPPPKSASEIQESWNTAGGVLIVMGIIWLYVSVLAAGGVTFVHCAVGAFLVLVGLTAPQVAKTQVVPQVASQAPKIQLPPEVVAAQKNLQFLKMRYTALEQKKKSSTAKIADYKRKVEILEHHLQKPYL